MADAILAGAFLALLLWSSQAGAHDYTVERIKIEHPWSRPTKGKDTPGVGYMVFDNSGEEDDRLIAATSPAAESVTMHQTDIGSGVASMIPLEAIPIPAHGSVALGPVGYHLMFERLKRPFAAEQMIPLTLTFERAGKITVELAVGRSPTPPGEHGSQQEPHGQ